MRSWPNIKIILGDNVKLASQLLLLLVSVYVFIMAEENFRLKLFVLFIGLFSWFFFSYKTSHPLIWFILFVLLILDLYQFYFGVANHHFLLTFVVFSVIVYQYHNSKVILQKNIQILMVVVILTSAIQKILSDQYVSGNFYYYMINRAFIFDVFHRFFPEILDIAKDNSERILALHKTNPNNNESIILQDVYPNLAFISLFYSRLTIIFEVIVGLALLWKPKSILTHLFLSLMILGILITRLEIGFMGLLAICGIFLCKNIKLRFLYTIIAMGCISLMVVRVGFH